MNEAITASPAQGLSHHAMRTRISAVAACHLNRVESRR